MKNPLQLLGKKWGVSGFQFVLICLAFAGAGMTVVLLKPIVFDLLLPTDAHQGFKWLIYVLALFPIYQLALLGYGCCLGQFDFFWKKQKNLIIAISKLFNNRVNKQDDST